MPIAGQTPTKTTREETSHGKRSSHRRVRPVFGTAGTENAGRMLSLFAGCVQLRRAECNGAALQHRRKAGQESIHNGIYGLKDAGIADDDLVLVHDAVRPLLSQDIISSNIAICKKYGYAITGIKCREAILESDDGFATTTSIPRDKLIRTQTPQTFRLKNLIAAHEEAAARGIANSVASCTLMAELGGREMHIVPGSEKNIKVTTIEDLEILKALMHVEKEAWIK